MHRLLASGPPQGPKARLSRGLLQARQAASWQHRRGRVRVGLLGQGPGRLLGAPREPGSCVGVHKPRHWAAAPLHEGHAEAAQGHAGVLLAAGQLL